MKDRIADRWGFELPTEYLQLQALGAFDVPLCDASSDAWVDFFLSGPVRLLLTDLRWLALEQIAELEPSEYQVPRLIPFARSARGDLWCWYPVMSGEHGAPVVFCPRDCEVAEVYAESFVDFLYRRLLDELSGTWLDEDFTHEQLKTLWRRYVELLEPFLNSGWSRTLRTLLDRPFIIDGDVLGLIPESEADAIVARDLPSPRVGSEFKHYV